MAKAKKIVKTDPNVQQYVMVRAFDTLNGETPENIKHSPESYFNELCDGAYVIDPESVKSELNHLDDSVVLDTFEIRFVSRQTLRRNTTTKLVDVNIN